MSSPGFDFASATNSFRFFAGTRSALTTKMFGTCARSVIGTKSLSTLYGSFGNMYGFTASVPTWPRISV